MSKKVAILLSPPISTFEFACAVELFALPRPEYPTWYQSDVVSFEKEDHPATGNIVIKTNKVLSHSDGFKSYDMVVIPAWSGLDTKPTLSLINNLVKFHQQGGTLVSFCSGSFAIAQTGLLDGLEATTHWNYADNFRKKFPKIIFKDNVLFTDNNRILTSAGSAAGLDLGMHIIKKDFGAAVANEVAKRLLISSQREGGQAQYANKTQTTHSNNLKQTLKWAQNNLHNNLTIDQMADQACYSRRTFDRHFQKSIGMSPKKWLIHQRITLARELLETSTHNMEQIAEASGFGSAMNLRHHFSQILGVSPSHYRNQFLKN